MPLFADILRLADLDVAERRVFVRADLDAALSPFGGVLDDAPLRALLPTLRELVAAGAKIVLAGTLSTEGQPAPSTAAASIAFRLGELLGQRVGVLRRNFAADIALLQPGQVALTPDLSDYPEELGNDAEFAQRLARSLDVYVGDGVRAARSPHATVERLPRLLSARGAGLQLGRNLEMLERLTDSNVPRPYVAVVGGDGFAKKSRLLWALLLRADTLLLGGVVANTCLAARGIQLGRSRYEPDQVDQARAFLASAQAQGVAVELPIDAVTMQPERGIGTTERRTIDRVPSNEAVVDLRLQTSVAYGEVLRSATTVLWTGLMGMAEIDELCAGTYRIGQAAPISAQYSVVFGGRTVVTAERMDLLAPFSFISRGNAGALTLASGVVLPGIESLRSRH